MHLQLQIPFKDVVFVNLCPGKSGSDVEEDLGQVSRAGHRCVDPLAGYKVEVGVEDGDRFVHRRALEGVAGATVAVNEVFLDQVLAQGEGLVGALVNDGEAVALDSVDGELEVDVEFQVLQLEVLSADQLLALFVLSGFSQVLAHRLRHKFTG